MGLYVRHVGLAQPHSCTHPPDNTERGSMASVHPHHGTR